MDGIWQGGRFVLQSTIEERIAKLEAERDKLAYMIEYIESLDPVIVEWARAGFQQEAKHE